MILLDLATFVAIAGSILAAPLWALAQVQGAPRVGWARAVAWLGLAIGFGLVCTLPLYALAIAAQGNGSPAIYAWTAPLFGVTSALLGVRVIGAHRRRLWGDGVLPRRLAWACLSFAAVLAVALAPWLVGAPLPFGGGMLGHEHILAGDSVNYLVHVVPIAVAMSVEALILLPRSWVTRASACLALFGVAGAMFLLRGSRWDAGFHIRQERAAQLRRADALDAPRQAALRQILAGRPPALSRDSCPWADLGLDWLPRPGFAAPPRDWETLTRYGSTWSWESATGRLSSIERAASPTNLESRRHENLRHRVQKPDDWIARRKVWMTPDEARQEARDWTGVDRWDHDATLVIGKVSWPRQNQDGTWDLGALDGSLWIWSYAKQAFICGGEVRIAHDAAPENVGSLSAGYWPDGLKMRAAAVAMEGLRAVTMP